MSGTGEQLSAFLDDELDSAESELFVRRIGKDGELRGAALRYSVIGEVMRGSLTDADPRTLVGAVAAGTAETPVESATPAPEPRRWLRPVAGAAVAATVAVAAVLSLQQNAVDGPPRAAVTVPEAAIDPTASPRLYTVPAEFSRRAGSSPDRLSEYYLNHAEYATLLRGQGQLVRIVTTPVSAPDDEAGGDQEPDASDAAEQPSGQ